MTQITTIMEDRVEQVNGILDEMVQYTGGKEAVTKDFADVLHLLIPGDGHRLLTLGNWRHSPALGPEIIDWLAARTGEEETHPPALRKVLPDEGEMVWVHAEHMLDDHWKISVFKIVFHEPEDEFLELRELKDLQAGDTERDPGRDPAMAVARIVGSGERVPRTGPGSARLT